jgi:hypothetical protein
LGTFVNSIIRSEIRQVILVDHAIFVIIRDTILKAINSAIFIDQSEQIPAVHIANKICINHFGLHIDDESRYRTAIARVIQGPDVKIVHTNAQRVIRQLKRLIIAAADRVGFTARDHVNRPRIAGYGSEPIANFYAKLEIEVSVSRFFIIKTEREITFDFSNF